MTLEADADHATVFFGYAQLRVKVSKLLREYKEGHLQAGDAVWIDDLQLWANSIQGSSDRGEL